VRVCVRVRVCVYVCVGGGVEWVCAWVGVCVCVCVVTTIPPRAPVTIVLIVFHSVWNFGDGRGGETVPYPPGHMARFFFGPGGRVYK